MDEAPRPLRAELRDHERILAALAQTGLALPGNLVTRSLRCGKASCRCKADPPQLHGPYHQWTRKIDGRTVTRWLNAEQAARYEAWFANARRLRDLFTELEGLALRMAERNEGWDAQKPPSGHRPRANTEPSAAPTSPSRKA